MFTFKARINLHVMAAHFHPFPYSPSKTCQFCKWEQKTGALTSRQVGLKCMETKQADEGGVGLPGMWFNYCLTAKQQTQTPTELLTKRNGSSSHRMTTNKRLESLARFYVLILLLYFLHFYSILFMYFFIFHLKAFF